MQYFGFDRPSFGIKTFGFGVSEFSPLDLFAGGKQGVWYDPSDKSTLFQDVAGTVPVTKDGDPVGLILDKSQGGGGFGTNLVPNGNFSSQNTDDWVISTINTAVTKEVKDGKLHITANTDGSPGYFILTIPTVVGKRYLLKTDWVKAGGGRFYVGTPDNDRAYSSGTSNPTGYYTAISDKIYLQVGATRGVSTQIIGNISVRELQGNHAIQSVSAARPIYKKDVDKAWLYYDKIDDKLLVELPAMTATVVKATDEGVSIDYPVNIAAGDYAITSTSALGRDYGYLIINKELSASEITQATNYFNTKRGV